MSGFNKVILVANLTRDPQLSHLPSNTSVVEIGLAVNRKWKDQQGNAKEEVCFIDCKAFGKMAETINQYFKKGNPILVEGRLALDTWEGTDGQKHSKHRVIVESFSFVGGKQDGQQAQPKPQPKPQPAPQKAPASGPEPDDSIPF